MAHRSDGPALSLVGVFKYGHRAVCSGVLIGGVLMFSKLKLLMRSFSCTAVVSVSNVVDPATEGPLTPTSHKERWLLLAN